MVEGEKKSHRDRIADLQRKIVGVKVPAGGGFEKFTTLYRQVRTIARAACRNLGAVGRQH